MSKQPAIAPIPGRRPVRPLMRAMTAALLVTGAHQVEYSRAPPQTSVHLAVEASRLVGAARASGLVNAVLPDAHVLEHAMTQARKLAALPTASVKLTKQMMKSAQAALVDQTMQDEGRLFRERLVSPEAKEAFTAFFEKRKPDFSRFN